MNGIWKRILALLLCFVMMVSVVPTEVFALEGIEPAEPAGEDPFGETPDGEDPDDGTSDGEDPDDGTSDRGPLGLTPDGGSNDGEPAGEDPDDGEGDETLLQKADRIFANPAAQILLSVSPSQSYSTSMKAGDTLNYTIGYGFRQAPTFQTGDKSMTMFDSYDNCKITVDLPEGLLLIGASSGDATYEYDTVTNSDGSHSYVFDLGSVTPGSKQFSFDIAVFICGNGTEDSVDSYSMTDAVNFTTDFVVLDKSHEPYTPVRTDPYEQEISATLPGFSTYTPDRWGVEKNPPQSVAISRDSMTATVVYTINVGMLDNNGELIRSLSDYNNITGRDAWAKNSADQEEVMLKDILSTQFFRDETALTGPTLKSATITHVPVTGNNTIAVPVTVDANGLRLTGDLAMNYAKVDADGLVTDGVRNEQQVPAYTSYTVTAIYELDESMIDTFDDPTSYIHFENDAVLEYRLSSQTQTQRAEDDAEIDAPVPVTEPASLVISKSLTDYNGSSKPYNNEFGPITYTVSSVSGDPFVVYSKNSDGSYSVSGSGTSVSVSTGTTYYLTAGTAYTVGETLNDYQARHMRINMANCSVKNGNAAATPNTLTFTPAEGENWKASIQNEELAVKVTVNKEDNNGDAVEGAVFTLTLVDEAGQPVPKSATDSTPLEQMTATTNGSGVATFSRVAYGTYSLVETTVPTGYTGSFSRTITVDSDTNVTVDATNTKNFVSLKLTKYAGIRQATLPQVGTNNGFSYSCFTLQRSSDNGTTWETAYDLNGDAVSSKSVSAATGTLSVNVPAFADDAGTTPYVYRFKEAIPEGWYDPISGSTTEAYTDTLTVVENGAAVQNTVEASLYNRRLVTLNVTKQFWNVNGNGTLTQYTGTDLTTDVTLYTFDGTTMTPVEGGAKTAYYNHRVTWSNLKLYDGDTKIQYYVSETDVAGYELDTTQSGGPVETIGGVKYLKVPVPTSDSASTISKTLYNIEQVVPVIIYKKSTYTNDFVSGSKVTVNQNGAAVTDLRTPATELTNQSIPDANGLLVYLAPGKVYSLTESTVPAHYAVVYPEGSDHYAIDLSDISVIKYKYNGTAKTCPVVKVTVYNDPDPIVSIAKGSVNGDLDTSIANQAVYEVYVKNAAGAYVPYQENGVNLTFKSRDTSTYKRLPEGTYYFHEKTVPAGCLDPDVFWDEFYSTLTGFGTFVHDDVTGFTFAVGVVEDATKSGNADNTCPFTFYNGRNVGSLKVQKYVDGVKGGANFSITVTGSDGTTVTTTTNANGVATVAGLPVYKADGSKIVYTVTESLTATQQNTYYKISDGQTATLTAKTTAGSQIVTSKDASGNELKVENGTFIKIGGTKVFIRAWEFPYTRMAYTTSGAVFGLYEKTVDEVTGDVTWVMKETTTTGPNGYFEFEGLRRDNVQYAVIEMAFPNPNMSPYVGDDWKEYCTATSVPDDDLHKYSYQIITPNNTKDKYDTDWFWNKDAWVQFDITKYMDYDENVNGTSVDHEDDPAIEGKDVDSPLNNAVFKLFRYKMPVGETAVDFDYDAWMDGETGGWELYGTYYSGSAYDDAGLRRPGEFVTNVDLNANNRVVYLLVETYAGPGRAYTNPNFKYTFYYEKSHTDFTVNVTEDDAPFTTTRTRPYTLNTHNYDELLNSKGPGSGSGAMYSTVRIAKWWDDLDEHGEYQREYEPLPNVTFGLYLDPACGEEDLLETLTVGQDNGIEGNTTVKAWAQGGLYCLTPSTTDNNTGLLRLLIEEPDPDDPGYNVDYVELGTFNAGTADEFNAYGVEVYLREESAPEGYFMDTTVHPMYLAFVKYADGRVPEAYNDAFFVKDADADVPLAEDQYGVPYCLTWPEDEDDPTTWVSYSSGQYRLVNYPMTDAKVTVKKYGYVPNESTLGLNSEELNAAYNAMSADDKAELHRQPLPGVTMTIEKWDIDARAFKPWDYINKTYKTAASTFTMKDDGTYTFGKGLPAGTYRIVETSLGSYANVYENAYPALGGVGAAYGRIFTVYGTDGKTIHMYNPAKVDVTLTKQDAEGNALDGVTFTLTPATGSALEAETGTDGKAVFSGIPGGVYTLTEEAEGYSVGYLEAYAASLDDTDPEKAALLALLSDDGCLIGYDYESETTTDSTYGYVNSRDVSIEEIGLSDTDFALTVQDPSLVSVSLKKTAEGGTAGLNGAKFSVYYWQFEDWDGTQAVPADVTSEGWSSVGTNQTTAKGGLLTFTAKEPGVYAFKETTAPSGYDVLTKPDGSDVIYYAVVKGGMDVTVTGLPATAAVSIPGSTETKNVTTLFTGDGSSAAVQVAVENRPKVEIKAAKTVDDHGLGVASGLAWTVYLDLYDQPTGGTALGTATVTKTASGTATNPFFKTGSNNTKLSQGKTYYVQERTISGYALQSVTVNGTAVSANASGRYPFTVTANSTVNVSVVNTYMSGTVIFRKVDEDDRDKYLTGAEFEVRKADGTTPVTGASVSEIVVDGEPTGVYQATIPLTSADPETFVIVETMAPNHYLLKDVRLTVQLDPAHNHLAWNDSEELTAALTLTNKLGWTLTIRKYDNIHTATDANTAAAGDASFSLYHLNADDEWELVEGCPVSISSAGIVEWLLLPDETYAFCESSFRTEKYVGIDGVYKDIGNGQLSELEPVPLEGVTGVSGYVLEEVDSNLVYRVYNVPKLTARVIKEDAGGYPANVVPLAQFKIYELEKPLADYNDPAALAAQLATSGTPVFTGNTTRITGTYTSACTWTDRDPTKNYVIVETNVSSGSAGKTYNTLNKSDDRVVWFVGVPTVADPAVGAEMRVDDFILENVYGEANVSVEKTVIDNPDTTLTPATAGDTDNASVNSTVDSFFYGDRKVSYQITPSVTGDNQPLTSFVLTDSGITFDSDGGSTAYAITSVGLSRVSHDVTNFLRDIPAAANNVDALVTWKDASGNTLGTKTVRVFSASDPDSVTDESLLLNAPAGTASFTVSYSSAAVANLGEGFVLGSDFTIVSPITVNATLKKQTSTKENMTAEVTGFTNGAAADLSYYVWSPAGSLSEEPVTHHDDDSAHIDVLEFELPEVELIKTSSPDQTVTVGQQVTYTLKIVNHSDTQLFRNPVLLDMLPTGVVLNNVIYTSGAQDETFSVNVEQYTGNAMYSFAGNVEADKETAVVLRMTGNLNPGSNVDVKLVCDVLDSAVLYGDHIHNYAFLSSAYHSLYTEDNPNGISFQNDLGEYPGALAQEAARFGTPDTADQLPIAREAALDDVLHDYTGADFAWVKSDSSIIVQMYSWLYPVKYIRGDQDLALSSDDNFLASATRTVIDTTTDEVVKSGWVQYMLSVSNGTKQDKHNVVIGDALSHKGDRSNGEARDSRWNTVLQNVTGITFGGVTNPEYQIYYYYGTAASADAAMRSALDDNTDCVDMPGNYYDPWLAKTALPANWCSPADLESLGKTLEDVTAFIVVFNPELVLKPGESVFVTYLTQTENIPDDDDFALANYENANNTFWVNWKEALESMESNTVSVTLTDGVADVEGDLWIDEDWDGIQQGSFDTDSSRTERDYSDYKIIQKLADATSFFLNDLRTKPASGWTDQGGSNSYGESILHFRFEGLGTALWVPTKGDLYVGNPLELNVGALKTSDPSRFSVTASVSDEDLLDIFKITSLGSGSYVSDNPDDTVTINGYDNNFFTSGDNANVFVTKPFFLHFSVGTDESKDIGFKMYRDLDLTKLAKDDATLPVPGAVFRLYGPFEEDTAANVSVTGTSAPATLRFTEVEDADGNVISYTYDPVNGSVTDLVTGTDGKLHVTGLNWWKEYIIREVSTAADLGFTLDGAVAVGNTDEDVGTRIVEGADPQTWVLKIPATTKVEKADEVTVSNVRSVSIAPKARKTLVNDGGSIKLKAGDFSFMLLDENGDPVQTGILNGTDGTTAYSDVTEIRFEDLVFHAEGEYVFTVEEELPEIPSDNFIYSDEVFTLKVDVVSKAGKLEATYAYYDENGDLMVDDDDEAILAPEFTNHYIPTPVEMPLYVEKIIDALESAKPTVAKEFVFTLAPVDDEPMPQKADGTVLTTVTLTNKDEDDNVVDRIRKLFGSIEFTAAGTYSYTLTETDETKGSNKDDYAGYTFDPVVHTIDVTVVDTNAHVLTWTCVVDDGLDTEKAFAESSSDPSVGAVVKSTNGFIPEPVALELPVSKGFSEESYDRPNKDTKLFYFEITADSSTAPLPFDAVSDETVTVISTKEGVTKNYPPITFTVPGDYVYVVKELAGEPTAAGVSDANYLGYDFSDTEYTVTAHVYDDDGKLRITWKTDKAETDPQLYFENDYIPEPTSVTLEVYKNFKDGSNTRPENWKKSFTFTLSPDEDELSNPLPDPDSIVIYDEGKESFKPIAFDKAGTYTYDLYEVIESYRGYVYDETHHEVVITVSDVDGQLTPVTTIDGQSALASHFFNEYHYESTDMPVYVSKLIDSITGEEPDPAKTFTFTIAPADVDTPAPKDKNGNAIETVTVTGADTAAFASIHYVAAGSYSYVIAEVDESKGSSADDYTNYSFDDTVHTLDVTVTDTQGKLTWTAVLDKDSADELTVTEDDDDKTIGVTAKFTNGYIPNPVVMPLYVSKLIDSYTGTEPTPKKVFTFSLTALDGAPAAKNAAGTTVPSVTVTGVEEKYFGSMTFTNVGTYSYTLVETDESKGANAGNYEGYTFDPVTHTVDVTVTDNGGQLVWTCVVDDGMSSEKTFAMDASDPNVGAIATFVNDYGLDPVELVLPVSKGFSSESMTRPTDKTFWFEISAVKAGDPLPQDETTKDTVTLISVVGSGSAEYPPISFKHPGDYSYVVKELAGEPTTSGTSKENYPGYTFDETEYTVTAAVVDNNGKLEVTWKTDKSATDPQLYFENDYIPEPVEMPLKVEKLLRCLTSSYPKVDKEFTFNLVALNGAPMPLDADGDPIVSVTVTGEDVGSFGEIVFSTPGTYCYELTEVDETAGSSADDYVGYTFDTATHTVEVTVSDIGGALGWVCVIDGDSEHAFTMSTDPSVSVVPQAGITNDYKPLPVKLVIPVSKELAGHPVAAGNDKTFYFTIASEKTTDPMPENGLTGVTVDQISVTGADTAYYPPITFEEEGDYVYSVAELDTAALHAPGYIYSAVVYTVTAHVWDENGQLQVSWKSDKLDSDDPLLFINTYKPEPAEVELKVTKTIDGQNVPLTPVDWRQTFTFTLEQAETDAVEAMPLNADNETVDSVEIFDEGTEAFPVISYPTAGTYNYTLTEEAETVDGYTYSTVTHVIKVEVEDHNGQLAATVSLDGSDYDAADGEVVSVESEFVNTYIPEEVAVRFPVRKEIDAPKGDTPEDKEFTFELEGKLGTEPMPSGDGAAVTVLGEAEGVFGEIVFTEAGTYTYVVSEAEGDDYGYAYDKKTHSYTVTVIDNKGHLEASFVVDDSDEIAVFTNLYIPDATSLAIPVKKIVDGKTPEDKIFTFELEGKLGTEPMPADAVDGVSETTVTGSGSSAFALIPYDKAGEYVYSVSEVPGSDNGYSYDDVVYVMTVTVTDTEGKLSASYELEEGKNEILFTNPYVTEPDSVIIPVKKTVEGPVPEDMDKTFTFELKGKLGTEPMPDDAEDGVAAVTVVGSGEEEFGEIIFVESGEYAYVLTEVDSGETGYTYDTEPREILVTVTDIGGELVAEWTLDGKTVETVSFVNEYEPEPVKATLQVTKILENLKLQSNMFTFTLKDSNGSVLETVKNKSNGDVIFSEFTYDEVGVYVYTVTEVEGNETGVTYDKKTITITVTVTDEDGKLVAEVEGTDKMTFVNHYDPYIPKTGYGPNNFALLGSAGIASLFTLLWAGRKLRKKKSEEE